MTRRLTMALPSKGRLREPSWTLLEASGVSPQEPGERMLQSHCRNADIDLLFVRADDVPEYVQDGVVDCGITGFDLINERECNVDVLLRLGFGTCSLQAAVSNEDEATQIADLEGRRIATSHPRIAAKALAERGITAEIVSVAGSVEISPRLGLADAIVDLVSTGSTLRTNGLRAIGVLFESEAVLIGQVNAKDSEARRTLTTVLGSVINARANRYLLCNVSKSRLDEVTAVLPTSGSPTVMDLATPGVVAVHALVPAADIWALLPKRSSGSEFHLDFAHREDGAVSTPVKTDRAFTIEEIVSDVRERGDKALVEWSKLFDATTSNSPERAVAYGDIPTAAVLAAAEAVRTWHAAQRPADLMMEVTPGVTLERRWSPLRSVGIYVPRGLVSSLIMSAVPAQVAGVERIVVCTPPNGSAAVAATAALLGIEEVWAVGGAQAIAAMAYGTESIAPVDKIFGPGNSAVNTAKLIVSRDVAIDLPAGPSEIVVVADEGVDEAIIAQEIAAQMEHGPDSRGFVVRVGDDLEAALVEVEKYAAEHVFLLGERAETLAPRIRNAGAVFVGLYSPVPAGDYATGGNHVLPTGGWSKSTGGLGLEGFMKTVTVQRVTKEGLERLAPTIEALAELEGMMAHKATARR